MRKHIPLPIAKLEEKTKVVAMKNLASPQGKRVRCSEIWGGNGNDLDVCTSGINAPVYSLASTNRR